MEQILAEAARQAPALCVLVLFCILFLKFLREERRQHIKIEEERLKVLEHIGDDCHAHSLKITRTMAASMEQNSQIIKENTRVLGQVTMVISQLQIKREMDQRSHREEAERHRKRRGEE